ncbi:hypothetical protein BH11PSE8_BH11PSE8_13690 [soil metagenome]
MAHADEDALKRLLPLLRQLREIKGLREMKPGIFYIRGAAFIHFHEDAGVLVADLKKTTGTGFDRYPVDAPTGQRKLVDDAKRRAGRAGDDD